MKFFSFLFLVLFLTSCVTNHGQFTVLSNKLVDVKHFKLDSNKVKKNIVGKDIAHVLVFVPTKVNPNINEALNDAFRKTDTDVMTDVTVTSWAWYIPYIYGQTGWKVEGDALKTRGN